MLKVADPCPRVLFTSDGRMKWEMNKWFRAPSVVMQVLYQTVVVKK